MQCILQKLENKIIVVCPRNQLMVHEGTSVSSKNVENPDHLSFNQTQKQVPSPKIKENKPDTIKLHGLVIFRHKYFFFQP